MINRNKINGMETGLVTSLAAVLVIFEVFPSFSYSRLSTSINNEEMTGYDADVIYEIPPLPDEPDQLNVDEILKQENFDIQPVEVLNLNADTTGLRTIRTVNMNIEMFPDNDPDHGIPDPGTFIPHSQPPLCTYRPQPEYPDIASQVGFEGRVTIQLFVNIAGFPEEAIVVQSSGLESMDMAALASAQATSWIPAKKDDGVSVGVWTSMIFEFVLE